MSRVVVALKYFFFGGWEGEGGGGVGKVLKNVGHHGWSTKKLLGFEWLKTTQMALKFLCFFRNIFKYVQDLSCLLKEIL